MHPHTLTLTPTLPTISMVDMGVWGSEWVGARHGNVGVLVHVCVWLHACMPCTSGVAPWPALTWLTRIVPCAFSSSANTTSRCPFWHAIKSGVAPSVVLAWVASIAGSMRVIVRVSVRVTLRMRVWAWG